MNDTVEFSSVLEVHGLACLRNRTNLPFRIMVDTTFNIGA